MSSPTDAPTTDERREAARDAKREGWIAQARAFSEENDCIAFLVDEEPCGTSAVTAPALRNASAIRYPVGEGEALIAVHYPDKWVYRGRWAQVRAATLQAAVAKAREE